MRALDLARNADPGFTPGSTPDFTPDSESTSVAVSSNKNAEPLYFTLLASSPVALDRQWSLSRRAHCKTAMRS